MLRVASDVGGTFTDLVYFEIDKKTGKVVGFITRIGDAYFNKYKDIKSDDSK